MRQHAVPGCRNNGLKRLHRAARATKRFEYSAPDLFHGFFAWRLRSGIHRCHWTLTDALRDYRAKLPILDYLDLWVCLTDFA